MSVWDKKPPCGGWLFAKKTACRRFLFLFNLRFLVQHVLAGNGIVLSGFHLFWMEALVLGSSVKMPCASAGNEPDFVTHSRFLRMT
jgi:hypothetical protein